MHEMHRIIPCISWFYSTSKAEVSMNFLVLYHEQLPRYKTTKFGGIIPCFFSPCTHGDYWTKRHSGMAITRTFASPNLYEGFSQEWQYGREFSSDVFIRNKKIGFA